MCSPRHQPHLLTFPSWHITSCVSLNFRYVFYSAVDGPDLVAQELSMMHNMHTAITQERFKDAGKMSLVYDCIKYFMPSRLLKSLNLLPFESWKLGIPKAC